MTDYHCHQNLGRTGFRVDGAILYTRPDKYTRIEEPLFKNRREKVSAVLSHTSGDNRQLRASKSGELSLLGSPNKLPRSVQNLSGIGSSSGNRGGGWFDQAAVWTSKAWQKHNHQVSFLRLCDAGRVSGDDRSIRRDLAITEGSCEEL